MGRHLVIDSSDFYGPLVLTGDGQALRPGDEGFEEARSRAVTFDPPPLDLAEMVDLGYIWEGRFFLTGEGEVSVERFNEVAGGPIGRTGYSVSFSVDDDE